MTEEQVYHIAERVLARDFPALMQAYDAQKEAEADLLARQRREMDALRRSGPMHDLLDRAR